MRNILCLLALLIASLADGKQIDKSTAANIGRSFLERHSPTLGKKSVQGLVLAHTETSISATPTTQSTSKFSSPSSSSISQSDTLSIYYAFNVEGGGFIIVSGDNKAVPVLGYANSGVFEADELPPNAAKWLNGYKDEIRHAIETDFVPAPENAADWEDLLGSKPLPAGKAAATATVAPLIQTKWDQGTYYNAQCPANTATGCVATAMTQIMKYWAYPAKGTGFHSYNHPIYGTLSANFGNTNYQWSSMPNVVSAPNSAVAILTYHAGVSVNMEYGPAETGGSGAYVIDAASPTQFTAEYALKTHFGYKNTLRGVRRSNYTSSSWISLLKAELDAGRPILHAGYGSGGGHAFVCDGYDASNRFHFNWGWSGQFDGYYAISALNPSGVGTGGGTGGFNSDQQAIIGIEPPNASTSQSISLYSTLTPSTQTINYGTSFSVTTNVVNTGSTSFTGDWCAAVFDSFNNFVEYVEVKSGWTLNANHVYTNGLTFTSPGTFKMLPQNYSVSVFYRPTGGEWTQVSNSGSYSNYAQIRVVNPSNIEMNSAITATPGIVLTQNQSASFRLNLLNNSTSTFYGQYKVSLYHLDGSFAQTITTISENAGLPPNYTYLSPYLTFSTSSISVAPGSYLLAVEHKASSSGSYTVTGSSFYQNPINVTVRTADVPQDNFEPNNSTPQATNLGLSFSNNSAISNTTGASCHTGTDNDYYKITFPSGWNYSVNTRLHDSYNSTNGNTYTLDALFSYSFDGVNWSETFDHVMPSNIAVNGAATLYFRVAPYFSGKTGTYLLASTITRSQGTGLADAAEGLYSTRIHPLPANDYVTITFKNPQTLVRRVTVHDVSGSRILATRSQANSNSITVPLTNIPSGSYQLMIQTDGEVVRKELTVKK